MGEPLGRGGMATVYSCASVLSPRLRGALKVVDVRAEPGGRERFVREIETLAALRHQALIRVLAAGEEPRRGVLYMVMELIEGEDLAQRLGRERLGWRDAARLFRDVADGLHHAHEVGVHHRDMKPANVMITRSGGGVLVDFGIALDQERTRLTEVGMVPGTVAYMPPELLLSDTRSIDPALADVYAFGLVFYEALTRQRAFPGFKQASRQDLIRLVKEKLAHEPFDPGEAAPAAIRSLIKGCTQPMPLRRPRMKGVVRLLDIALGPAPGLVTATDEDEATVVVSMEMLTSALEAESTFPIGTAQLTPSPASQMETHVLQREAIEQAMAELEAAPFEDVSDRRQSFDQDVIRQELARRRPRRDERSQALLWGTAFGVVLLLASGGAAAFFLVWWWVV